MHIPYTASDQPTNRQLDFQSCSGQLKNIVELFGGGSVIIGPTPSSFQECKSSFNFMTIDIQGLSNDRTFI